MFTEAEVRAQLAANAQPWSGFATALANLYRTAEPELVDYILHYCLPSASSPFPRDTPDEWRLRFIQECESLGCSDTVRPRAMMVPARLDPVVVVARNGPPPIVNRDPLDAEHRARLSARRSPMSRRHGSRLAEAALGLKGAFRWTKSGPREPGFAGHLGSDYMPKSAWNQTRTNLGIEDHEMRRNDFAAWMDGGAPPTRHSRMNCWEAVFCSAYDAGLADAVQLRTMHRKAALSYELGDRLRRDAGAGSGYYRALNVALGFRDSVPFRPEAGLIPQKGDILFWDENEHVAISLGRRWVGKAAVDSMMSLWLHRNGTFAELELDEVHTIALTALRFAPCPF